MATKKKAKKKKDEGLYVMAEDGSFETVLVAGSLEVIGSVIEEEIGNGFATRDEILQRYDLFRVEMVPFEMEVRTEITIVPQ
jgi:hypothetical protein